MFSHNSLHECDVIKTNVTTSVDDDVSQQNPGRHSQCGDLQAAVMAEKEPHRVRFIEVKPSKGDEENISPCVHVCKNDNAISPLNQTHTAKNDSKKFFPLKPPIPNAQRDKIENSFREVDITISNHIQDMFLAQEAKGTAKLEKLDMNLPNAKKTKGDIIDGNQPKAKKKNRKRKNRRVLPLDDKNGQAGDNPETGSGTSVKTKKKQTSTMQTKKTKESKTEIKEGTVKVAPSEKDKTPKEDMDKEANTRRKLPCLFGFIATWLAKRKEKRREKKRKAIAARASPERLVEYGHKTAHGGEAFTIELDSRPICLRKPLLPPIIQTSGPIRREKYHNADCRRDDFLEQKKEAAREYEKKKTRCKERKYEKDLQFRHKTELGIRQKQVIAERNRELQSRCKSRLRAPSLGPSLGPSAGPSKEPSAEPSLISITGPSFYSDNEYDRYSPNVDEDVDIPIF